jgi:hypothetical protein
MNRDTGKSRPATIRFRHKIGLTYVSSSGPRVPLARLAAVHAALLEGEKGRIRQREG